MALAHIVPSLASTTMSACHPCRKILDPKPTLFLTRDESAALIHFLNLGLQVGESVLHKLNFFFVRVTPD
jgi:hypothetical protein